MSSAPTSIVRARPRRAARPGPCVGAFFDMDKTLIAENSGSLFMKYRYQKGEIGGIDLLKGLGAYLQYKLGVLDIRNWTKQMMVQFRGEREAKLETRIEEARARLESLERRVELLRSDPVTLERLAREQRGLVMPDDLVVVLPCHRDRLWHVPVARREGQR